MAFTSTGGSHSVSEGCQKPGQEGGGGSILPHWHMPKDLARAQPRGSAPRPPLRTSVGTVEVDICVRFKSLVRQAGWGMRIGELARRTGVSERSLRYYETQGLLRAERTPGGHREYGDWAVDRVIRIQALYAAGLPSR